MKLKRHWVGPFQISKVIFPIAYQLELPAGWQIHPTFHASHLKAYIRHLEFEREVEPPPPVLVDDDLEYEVEAILHHCGKGAQGRYLTLWKGYPFPEATWELESHLLNAPDILADYLQHVQHTTPRTQKTTRGEGASEEQMASQISLYGMGLAGIGSFDVTWESRLAHPSDLYRL